MSTRQVLPRSVGTNACSVVPVWPRGLGVVFRFPPVTLRHYPLLTRPHHYGRRVRCRVYGSSVVPWFGGSWYVRSGFQNRADPAPCGAVTAQSRQPGLADWIPDGLLARPPGVGGPGPVGHLARRTQKSNRRAIFRKIIRRWGATACAFVPTLECTSRYVFCTLWNVGP